MYADNETIQIDQFKNFNYFIVFLLFNVYKTQQEVKEI